MDRQTRANYFDGAVVQSTYTPEGLQDTVTDSRGTTSYGYDVHDRLIRTNYPDGQFVAYSYDKSSNLLSMATPAGTTSYTYNKINQMLTATNSTVGSTSFTYDPVGLPKTMTLPNGVVTTYGYDPLDRLTNVTQQRSGTTLGAYAYTLDNVGNRTRVVEQGGGSIRWMYDDAYRLLSETRYDPSSFTYDPNGNRLTEIVDGVTTTYTYNDLDQMTSDGTNTYAYDDRGNLIGSSDGTQYQYDAQDRMVGVTLPDTTVITYEYDADGRRVAQTVNGQKTKYVWDQRSTYGDVVLETNAANTPQVAYTMAEDRILAQTRGGVNSYYLSDGQGSTRALTNSTGAITDTYSYTAFGEIYNQTGTTANNYLYTGQQFDALTGLYSLRARYYAPGVGRFLSQDTHPYDFQNPVEINRYGYTANNPVNFADPSGHNSAETGTQTAAEAFAVLLLSGQLELTPYVVASTGSSVVYGHIIGLVVLTALATVIGIITQIALPTTQPQTYPNTGPLPPPGSLPIPKPNPTPAPTPPPASNPPGTTSDPSTGPNPGPNQLPNPNAQRPAPAPAPAPKQKPAPTQQPCRPDEDDCDPLTDPDCAPKRCDPVAFTTWWSWRRPVLNSLQPGNPNYEYEQRVARANGAYGDYSRRVNAGLTETIDVDGIEPSTCRFVDGKFNKNVKAPQYSEDGPPWISDEAKNQELIDVLRRYRLAIATPTGEPGAQPTGLIIRTNTRESETFFTNLLISQGFTLNVDGFVEYVP